jgi:hypothetical protein
MSYREKSFKALHGSIALTADDLRSAEEGFSAGVSRHLETSSLKGVSSFSSARRGRWVVEALVSAIRALAGAPRLTVTQDARRELPRSRLRPITDLSIARQPCPLYRGCFSTGSRICPEVVGQDHSAPPQPFAHPPKVCELFPAAITGLVGGRLKFSAAGSTYCGSTSRRCVPEPRSEAVGQKSE